MIGCQTASNLKAVWPFLPPAICLPRFTTAPIHSPVPCRCTFPCRLRYLFLPLSCCHTYQWLMWRLMEMQIFHLHPTPHRPLCLHLLHLSTMLTISKHCSLPMTCSVSGTNAGTASSAGTSAGAAPSASQARVRVRVRERVWGQERCCGMHG